MAGRGAGFVISVGIKNLSSDLTKPKAGANSIVTVCFCLKPMIASEALWAASTTGAVILRARLTGRARVFGCVSGFARHSSIKGNPGGEFCV